ncbi:MAG TPA: Ni/Fe hydrogenase subunit alpha [Gammaproteobacteria bacterium]|nr:Ni/Fe hydrogenase subunit alpha [Gammaproteobacteria bacterium]
MADRRRIEINVPALARVEGEGALELRIENQAITDLKLRIFEPPRLFEKFLEGRNCREVPDMVARICGICPVAYQMSAVQALEAILGITPGPWVRAMRRVYYCGEWIESHALHIHLLAAPDFLGARDITALARSHPGAVHRGLRLQALGNDIIRFLGARSVNPVGARVGGFYHAPPEDAAAALCERIHAALPEAEALVRWTASLPFPEQRQDFNQVALRHGGEYPMNEGRIVSSRGLAITADDFECHFEEHQHPHSTALHCLLDNAPYLVGPLARLNLNLDCLPAALRALVAESGVTFPSNNMFHSITARAVEIHYALSEALRLLEGYRRPSSPYEETTPRAGVGCGATEAPRGLLWHRYELDEQGRVRRARIVPPTSQNQARIEEDLRTALPAFGLARDQEALRRFSEQLIRNYDPCISCATHFLDLRVQRC